MSWLYLLWFLVGNGSGIWYNWFWYFGLVLVFWYWFSVFWYHCGGADVRKKHCRWTAASETETETDGDGDGARKSAKEIERV